MMTMGNQYRPEPPKRDWRDFFIMAVVSGGVMYGMASLARKYLLPHLQPPTTTSFQQTSTELAEQFDEASKLLAELQEQTTDLQSSVEKEREKVDAVVEEVGDAVQKVKDGEERWREEMREMREEIQELRELVPKVSCTFCDRPPRSRVGKRRACFDSMRLFPVRNAAHSIPSHRWSRNTPENRLDRSLISKTTSSH